MRTLSLRRRPSAVEGEHSCICPRTNVDGSLHGSVGEVTAAVRKECYEAFKAAAGSDVRTILEAYQNLLAAKNGIRQKTKDRKIEFNKATAKLSGLVRRLINTTYLDSSLCLSNIDGQLRDAAWVQRCICPLGQYPKLRQWVSETSRD